LAFGVGCRAQCGEGSIGDQLVARLVGINIFGRGFDGLSGLARIQRLE
jgi:hypothetical protein